MTRMLLLAIGLLLLSGCATTRITVARVHGSPTVTVELDGERMWRHES